MLQCPDGTFIRRKGFVISRAKPFNGYCACENSSRDLNYTEVRPLHDDTISPRIYYAGIFKKNTLNEYIESLFFMILVLFPLFLIF